MSTIKLRKYQTVLNQRINDAWLNGASNILAVLPTGGGKTVCISSLVEGIVSCVIAHRQELVSQISLALAKNGITHRIIGSQKVIKMIVGMHMLQFGRSYYNHQAKTAVAGVDTLIRRGDELKNWLPTVKLWVTDEAHHLTKENKWGKAVSMFPNAKGLGVTATPLRADGRGLGREFDGVMDVMIVGSSMRQLINDGHLTEYRIFAPVTTDLDLTEVKLTASGDYSKKGISEAVANSGLVVHEKSTVVGDVVSHYQRIAPGKLGITFVPDMETGREIEAQFNSVGVPAVLVNAKTPCDQRAAILRKFATKEYMQLINVDLFGEGFDLPAIECLSMARPTASYGLFVQMFGRVLRLMQGKKHGLIIDHVGNVAKHGLPDAPRQWTLERKTKKQQSVPTTVKSCPACTFVYPRFKRECPDCGYYPEPVERRSLEHVDGDLTELHKDTLATMRGEVDAVNRSVEVQVEEYRAGLYQGGKWNDAHCRRKHKEVIATQQSQKVLRDNMAQWGGNQRAEGRSNDEIFKIFYITFDIDWLSAQALGCDDASALNERIKI
jgi:superfamily II DNA or RNA helicase